MTEKVKVLFLCTHNYARSQMAEGVRDEITRWIDEALGERHA